MEGMAQLVPPSGTPSAKEWALSMSGKSVLLATGILVLLAVGVAATLLILVRHEPAFYRAAAQGPGMTRKNHSVEFCQQLTQLISAMNDAREWSAQFTDEQINS